MVEYILTLAACFGFMLLLLDQICDRISEYQAKNLKSAERIAFLKACEAKGWPEGYEHNEED